MRSAVPLIASLSAENIKGIKAFFKGKPMINILFTSSLALAVVSGLSWFIEKDTQTAIFSMLAAIYLLNMAFCIKKDIDKF